MGEPRKGRGLGTISPLWSPSLWRTQKRKLQGGLTQMTLLRDWPTLWKTGRFIYLFTCLLIYLVIFIQLTVPIAPCSQKTCSLWWKRILIRFLINGSPLNYKGFLRVKFQGNILSFINPLYQIAQEEMRQGHCFLFSKEVTKMASGSDVFLWDCHSLRHFVPFSLGSFSFSFFSSF